jgi:hypothetical protein
MYLKMNGTVSEMQLELLRMIEALKNVQRECEEIFMDASETYGEN